MLSVVEWLASTSSKKLKGPRSLDREPFFVPEFFWQVHRVRGEQDLPVLLAVMERVKKKTLCILWKTWIILSVNLRVDRHAARGWVFHRVPGHKRGHNRGG